MLDLKLQVALWGYRSVCEALPALSRDQLHEALHHEANGRRRRSVVKRLIQRICVVEGEIIKAQLLAKFREGTL